MAKPYTININNGIGTGEVLDGTYTVSSNSIGYDNTSIDPKSLIIDSTHNEFSLTISATGTLTFHVTEEGNESGTPIVGAKFIRCDSESNTYGEEKISDSNGNVVFNNVPYKDTNTPLIYYKQTASDLNHEFDNTLGQTGLVLSTRTIEIQNKKPALRTFSLTDANYSGLNIQTSEITLS